MIITGKYTIFKDKEIIEQKNNIQNDGFELMQSWFLTNENQTSKKINLMENTTIQTTGFVSYGGDLLEPVRDYSDNYIQSNQKESSYIIEFTDPQDIYALGIDCDYFLEQNTVNTLIKVEYKKSSSTQYIPVSDLLIPAFQREQIEVDNRLENEKTYYLNSTIKAKTIKLTFGSFLPSDYSGYVSYFLYKLRLYSKPSIVFPPTHVSLYAETLTDLNISEKTPLLRKEITHVISDSTINYSVIFKLNLELDDLNSSDTVYAITLDYKNDSEVFVPFSMANFITPWQQEALETVEVQYQLSMSNS